MIELTVVDALESKRKKWREYAKRRYKQQRDRIRAQRKAYREKNKKTFSDNEKRRYRARRKAMGFTVKELRPRETLTPEMIQETKRAAHRRWADRNRIELRRRQRTAFAEKKSKLQREDPVGYAAFIARRAAYDKEYRHREKAKRRAWNQAHVQRKQNDPNFHLARRIRARIRVAIRKCYGKKAAKSMALLGCSIEEARRRIEAQFQPGMSWELFVQGKIHLDHKKPCILFDLTKESEQRACFNISNLQPLWSVDNLKKGASFPLPSLAPVP